MHSRGSLANGLLFQYQSPNLTSAQHSLASDAAPSKFSEFRSRPVGAASCNTITCANCIAKAACVSHYLVLQSASLIPQDAGIWHADSSVCGSGDSLHNFSDFSMSFSLAMSRWLCSICSIITQSRLPGFAGLRASCGHSGRL